MTVVLVLLLLLLLFGGGYGGWRQWGGVGASGVVGLLIAILLILWLLGALPLHGQETSQPATSATPLIAFADPGTPAADVTGQPSAAPIATIVPAPPDVTAAEVKAVAEQSAENLEAVASNEIGIAEATRDPTSGAPDPGSGSTFWLIAMFFGSVVRPITDNVVGRIKSIDDKLSGSVNTVALIVTYVAAWALFHSSNPSLPQDALAWIIAGLAAAGLGSATTGGIRAMNANKPAATTTP